MRALCAALSLLLAAAGPSHPQAFQSSRLDAAQKLYDAGRYAESAGTLSAQELQKLDSRERPRAYILLAMSAERLGRPDQSLGVLQLAAGLFPKDIDVVSRLADILHRTGLDERARPVYLRVLSIHPNNAAAHLGLAEIEFSLGSLDESITHYERCLEQWKDSPDIWRGYAEALSGKRDYPRAAAALERSLTLAPRHVDSLRSLADFQRRLGRRRDAYGTLDRALGADAAGGKSRQLELTLQRALWQLEDGELAAGRRQAEEALRLSPGNPLALWVRAGVALRKGFVQEAISDLETAKSGDREAPFTAAAAAALLRELQPQNATVRPEKGE